MHFARPRGDAPSAETKVRRDDGTTRRRGDAPSTETTGRDDGSRRRGETTERRRDVQSPMKSSMELAAEFPARAKDRNRGKSAKKKEYPGGSTI